MSLMLPLALFQSCLTAGQLVKVYKVVGITSYVHLLMEYLPEKRNKINYSNLDFK